MSDNATETVGEALARVQVKAKSPPAPAGVEPIERFNLTSLWMQQGSHDKVYFLWVEGDRRTGIFTAQFAYGRRGSTLQRGAKTKSKSFTECSRECARFALEKVAKGYRDVSGTPPPPGSKAWPVHIPNQQAPFVGTWSHR